MATDRVLSREQLRESLRNDTLVIPDLQVVLEKWPQYIHPELDRLREDLEKRLPELFLEGDRLRKTKAADFGLLVAGWYPYAPYESLRIVLYLYLWLFMWDDETDSLEFSSLKNDSDEANSFFAKTMTYIQNSLGLDTNASLSEISSDPIITSFEPIGEAFAKSCSKPQITRFSNELARYVQMTELEQRVQLSEKFPTVEEYLHRRLGSSAVDVSTAAVEYCFGTEIPSSVMCEHDMKIIWRETNMIISVMNDILSLKKEIEQGEVDTLIPLLYLRYGTLDAAMNAALDIIHASISSFEISSRRLLDMYFRDKEVHAMLVKFIHACRCACTANLNWSLQSGRYRLNCESLRNGFTVTL